MSDPLLDQYATDDNLQARIAIHSRFATNPHWAEWLFERELPGPGERVLDVGCGPGTLWVANRDRIDPSWSLTLADLSPGMIEAARAGLGDVAEYLVAGVETLPFPDGSFDVVLANHMLYHVRDRPAAFAEIRRVLVSGGGFFASTVGRGHMRELSDLLGQRWAFSGVPEEFGLETGPGQLEPFFADVRVERFGSELLVTDVEPVLAYVRSSPTFEGGDLDDVREAVEGAIAREGSFRIGTATGVISCRNP